MRAALLAYAHAEARALATQDASAASSVATDAAVRTLQSTIGDLRARGVRLEPSLDGVTFLAFRATIDRAEVDTLDVWNQTFFDTQGKILRSGQSRGLHTQVFVRQANTWRFDTLRTCANTSARGPC